MSLKDEVLKILIEDFEMVWEREGQEQDFLNHKDYDSCEDRIKHGIKIATKRARKILSLAAAKHREESHGDDTKPEQIMLARSMSVEDQEVATRSSGWIA